MVKTHSISTGHRTIRYKASRDFSHPVVCKCNSSFVSTAFQLERGLSRGFLSHHMALRFQEICLASEAHQYSRRHRARCINRLISSRGSTVRTWRGLLTGWHLICLGSKCEIKGTFGERWMWRRGWWNGSLMEYDWTLMLCSGQNDGFSHFLVKWNTFVVFWHQKISEMKMISFSVQN